MWQAAAARGLRGAAQCILVLRERTPLNKAAPQRAQLHCVVALYVTRCLGTYSHKYWKRNNRGGRHDYSTGRKLTLKLTQNLGHNARHTWVDTTFDVPPVVRIPCASQSRLGCADAVGCTTESWFASDVGGSFGGYRMGSLQQLNLPHSEALVCRDGHANLFLRPITRNTPGAWGVLMNYWGDEDNHPRARRNLASEGCPACGNLITVYRHKDNPYRTTISRWICSSCPLWLHATLPCGPLLCRWIGRYADPLRIIR